jgi:hypothetical protein
VEHDRDHDRPCQIGVIRKTRNCSLSGLSGIEELFRYQHQERIHVSGDDSSREDRHSSKRRGKCTVVNEDDEDRSGYPGSATRNL